MGFPDPQPGQVIRYAYLWRDEFERGQDEGLKDRPCAVLLTVTRGADDVEVVVLPVTHAPPSDPALAVEIPALTKRRLGLDDQASWIVVTEANRFIWPGPDLRPVRGLGPDSVLLGLLPRGVFVEMREKFLSAAKAGQGRFVPRGE